MKDKPITLTTEQLNTQFSEKVNRILDTSKPKPTITATMVEENNSFLKDWKAENMPMSNDTAFMLNAILHEQKHYTEALKKNEETRDKHEQSIAVYRGVDAGFQFISQIGMVTENKTLATIGAVGAASASIALNVAMMKGMIPGIKLAGWGFSVPAFGIAMAGLTILTCLFKKKKKQDDPHMKAMIQLSQQIEQWGKLIYRRIDHMEAHMVEYFREMAYRSVAQTSLLKTIMDDGFDNVSFKINDIQADINRLTGLLTSGLSANYFQEFDHAIDNIAQLMLDKTDQTADIKRELRTLTTWLSNANYIKNTNGKWTSRPDLSANNLFSQSHLRHHDAMLNGPLEHKLGYLGEIASLLPDIKFDNVDLDRLVNIVLFTKGVEQYVQGRLHIGLHAAHKMDPEQESLNHIRSIANNGLRFMQQLIAQETTLMKPIVQQYEKTYHQLVFALQAAAHERLHAGTLPGFEFPTKDAIQPNFFPSNLKHTTTGTDLPIQLITTTLTNHGATMDRLIQNALKIGIGAIIVTYTPTPTNASVSWYGTEVGDYHGGVRLTNKQVAWNIQIHYHHQGLSHLLFTLTGKAGGNELASWYGKSKKYATHHQHDASHKQTAATINAQAADPYYSGAWTQTTIDAPIANPNVLDNALKTAIINSIVAECMTKPGLHPELSLAICADILKNHTLLHDYPRDLTLLKNLMLRFGMLLQSPLIKDIDALWDENAFINHMTTYHALQINIDAVKSAVNAPPLSSEPRKSHYISHYLYYSSHLLLTLANYESTAGFTAIDELSEKLDVDNEILLDPQCISLNESNFIGKGSFGQVYRASYHEGDNKPEQTVAVKKLFPGSKLLRGEIDVVTRLSKAIDYSQYLVAILGFTLINECESIVMEYVPCGTLAKHLYDKKMPLPYEQRLRIAQEIAAAVEWLHNHDILHGDLKSDNVLMAQDEQGYHAKVADFGLGKLTDDIQMGSSSVGPTDNSIAGTAAYQAPELFSVEGLGQRTFANDIWALGVMYHELLTSRRPFEKMPGGKPAIWTYMTRLSDGAKLPDYFTIPNDIGTKHPTLPLLREKLEPVILDCRAFLAKDRPSAEAILDRIGRPEQSI